MRKLNDAYLPVGDAFQLVYRPVYLVRRNAFILFAVLNGKVEGVEIRLEKNGNVGNPAERRQRKRRRQSEYIKKGFFDDFHKRSLSYG